jgi:hypothetical protein
VDGLVKGISPTTRKKPQEYGRIPRIFDALVGEIPHQAAAELSGVIYSLLT